MIPAECLDAYTACFDIDEPDLLCEHPRVTAIWGPDADILYPTCWKCMECGALVNGERKAVPI